MFNTGGLRGLPRLTTVGLPGLPTYNFLDKNVVRLFFMLQVVINFTLVKGLHYETRPAFHQWSDQSQAYGLSFASKHDAQVFGDDVLTALENLKTSGKAFKCCSNFFIYS